MIRPFSFLAAVFSAVTLPALALAGPVNPVTLGSLVFANPLTTFQGFEVVNSTGPVEGCDPAGASPVCTVLSFQNTVLTVTFSDNTTATRTPSGGFAFAPGAYIYGDNSGDDASQSFLFDPALTIVGATLTGTVAPASFQVTDGTAESSYFSNGSFSVSLDLSSSPPLAAADITTDVGGLVPEPSLALPVAIFLAGFVGWRRSVARPESFR